MNDWESFGMTDPAADRVVSMLVGRLTTLIRRPWAGKRPCGEGDTMRSVTKSTWSHHVVHGAHDVVDDEDKAQPALVDGADDEGVVGAGGRRRRRCKSHP
jgi:hypothetical protein